MIFLSRRARYEALPSLEQALHFERATRAFEEKGLAFGRAQQQSLKVLGLDGVYTRLGLLLSDECPYVIHCLAYQGRDASVFLDRRSFGGSLFAQLEEALDYLGLHNRVRGEIEGLYRRDTRDYPIAALREALINAVVHRDYAFPAQSRISLYSDRIEFMSIGGLVPGMAEEDVFAGVSVRRNAGLAEVFYRLQLIEGYGTGLQRMMEAYEGAARRPSIRVTPNSFTLTLPSQQVDATVSRAQPPAATSEALVMDQLQRDGSITRAEVEALLGVSTATAFRVLRSLTEGGLVLREGEGRRSRYVVRPRDD